MTWLKPQRAAVFWKQQIGREIKIDFFSIYILKILKSSKALSVNINSFCLFINHSYRYPMSLRLISILPYSFFFYSISGPTSSSSSFLHISTSCYKSRECANQQLLWTVNMKTWMLCEQCYIFFLFIKYNNMLKSGKRKKFNHPVTGKNWTLVGEFWDQ